MVGKRRQKRQRIALEQSFQRFGYEIGEKSWRREELYDRSTADLEQWRADQIQASVAESDAGKLISHSKVKKLASKWRRPK